MATGIPHKVMFYPGHTLPIQAPAMPLHFSARELFKNHGCPQGHKGSVGRHFGTRGHPWLMKDRLLSSRGTILKLVLHSSSKGSPQQWASVAQDNNQLKDMLFNWLPFFFVSQFSLLWTGILSHISSCHRSLCLHYYLGELDPRYRV